ncbi:MAG: hypothetical protein K2X86_16070 [Cytophagaceae bacterium]|nr:hypothetical protein [Cytophagaceae bacterium]
MKRYSTTLLVCLVLPLCVFGQDEEKKFCDPKLVGMSRSKGLVFAYERTLNSKISSTSSDTAIGNGSATVRGNNKLDFKLRIPVFNKPYLKIIVGFKYFFEEFKFDAPEGLNYYLYQNLEDKNLKTIGGNINILKPVNETTYLGIRFSSDLNGDYSADEFPKASFLKWSISGIFGWKKCETRTMGVGIHYSYTFGRRSIYPAFIFNNTFNRHWGIEALLPANLKIRHNFSEKTLLYAGYEIDGAAYHIKINNPPFANYPSLEFRRSSIKYSIDFEREIHDWLWLGVSAGIRQPLSLKLAKNASARKDVLINNKLSIAPYFNLSIFIVPPRTLENNIINAR